ncbi:MAG TPA: Hpt domain-containing protein, partial [Oligoflexus sp.]|uniref:Hpt domain-containing protein n=1 Tax=Oligoflexus sp. TaxID=1971216 RepID=UPI002D6988CB
MRFILLILIGTMVCLQQVIAAPSLSQQQQINRVIRLVYDEPLEAVRVGQELVREMTSEKDPESFVIIAAAIAEAAGMYGDAKEMTRWVEVALPLAESRSMLRERIILNSMKAVAFEFEGDFQNAEKQHKYSLDEARKGQNPQYEVIAAVYMAFFYTRAQDNKEFALLVDRTIPLFKTLPHDALYHIFLAIVGMAYDNAVFDRIDDSIRLLREAVGYFEGQSLKFLGYTFTHSLAITMLKRDPEEALRILNAGAAKNPIFQVPEHKAYADDLRGKIYFALKDYPKAIDFYSKATQYWNTKQTNVNFRQKVQIDIVRSYVELGQYDKAWEELQTVGQIESNKVHFHYMYHSTKAVIMQGLGRIQEENEALRLALKYYKAYLDEHSAEITKTAEAQLNLKRLEDSRKLLEAENKAQTAELDQARKTQKISLIILFLVICFLMLALHSIKKSREVRIKKQELQDILDTIEEGILQIGKDLCIHPDYSRYAEQLLGGEPLLGRNLMDVLFGEDTSSRETRSIVEQSLGFSIGEAGESWDFNSGHLPDQINRQGRTLSLFWQPLRDKANTIVIVILSIRDITKQVELEQKINAEKSLQEAFDQKLAEIKKVDVERACHFLIQHRDRMSSLVDYEAAGTPAWRTELHTLKGEARTLGLTSLSSCIHELESCLGHQDQNSRDSFARHIQAIASTMQQFQTVIDKFFT